MIYGPKEESNFLEFQAKLSGEETNDNKMTKEIKICDPKAADELCILRETYASTLTPFPSYTPMPMVKSWILKEASDDLIMNPCSSHK
jgi:hypothetical protein